MAHRSLCSCGVSVDVYLSMGLCACYSGKGVRLGRRLGGSGKGVRLGRTRGGSGQGVGLGRSRGSSGQGVGSGRSLGGSACVSCKLSLRRVGALGRQLPMLDTLFNYLFQPANEQGTARESDLAPVVFATSIKGQHGRHYLMNIIIGDHAGARRTHKDCLAPHTPGGTMDACTVVLVQLSARASGGRLRNGGTIGGTSGQLFVHCMLMFQIELCASWHRSFATALALRSRKPYRCPGD